MKRYNCNEHFLALKIEKKLALLNDDHSELQPIRFDKERERSALHPEYPLQPRRNHRRREGRGHVLRVFREEDRCSWEATLFPWRLWQEHAIRQEGRHLTSDSPDIRVSVIVKGKDRCRGPVERDPLTDGRLTTMCAPPRPLPIFLFRSIWSFLEKLGCLEKVIEDWA